MADPEVQKNSELLNDERWMRLALEEAAQAADHGDVPVGAVVVIGECVAGRGRNQTERRQDPTAHAEMLALRQAARVSGYYRMPSATLYVTLEPCAMCAGAIVLARIKRVVFGAWDPKAGACGSLRNVIQDHRLNHRCSQTGGILQQECSVQLKAFFSTLRGSRGT